MISLNNISIAFGGRDLLKNVSLQINPKDKIGLTGRNGSGKSTMLKIIAGEFSEFSGNVSIPKDTTIGYLPQYIKYSDKRSVFDETFSAFDDFKKLSAELDKLNTAIAERDDYNSPEYHKLLDRVSELSEKLAFLNEQNLIADTEKVLKGLGFQASDFQRPTSEFSGGWRMRIEIAKILLKNPDVLLLDEPTNHLDIESIRWLEEFLKNYKGAIIVISHDRLFLDNVTNRTVEISLGKIYDYPVAYSKYVELREIRKQQQLATYENQQQKIKTTERFIERFRAKATKASQVQSRIKMLDKMDKIEIEQEDTANINFRFPPAPRSGDIVVSISGITKKYNEHTVLQNIDFTLERGEKIAFVGKNGEGKTTLVKIITGETDFEGHLKIGHNVKIGYFAQNQEQKLDKNLTVFETLDHIAVGEVRTRLRAILGSFLFRDEDIDKKVSVLSGGEMARLALAKLILQPYNLLILDEPTNHLDIPAKEILKQALQQFDGTLIVVSHDRYFLDGLVETVYEFSNKKIKQYKGGINLFLEKKKIKAFNELVSQKKQAATQKEKTTSENKEDYLRRKEKKRNIEKIQRRIAEKEQEIENFENQIKEIEKKLSNPANIDDHSIFDDYDKLKTKLSEIYEQWEALHLELEELQNN